MSDAHRRQNEARRGRERPPVQSEGGPPIDAEVAIAAVERSPAFLLVLARLQQTASVMDCPFCGRVGVSPPSPAGLPRLLKPTAVLGVYEHCCFDRPARASWVSCKRRRLVVWEVDALLLDDRVARVVRRHLGTCSGGPENRDHDPAAKKRAECVSLWREYAGCPRGPVCVQNARTIVGS